MKGEDSMITWKDTINLIEKMFEISQKELAEILGVPESTISKIKNGKQASVFNREDIFKKVFSSLNSLFIFLILVISSRFAFFI